MDVHSPKNGMYRYWSIAIWGWFPYSPWHHVQKARAPWILWTARLHVSPAVEENVGNNMCMCIKACLWKLFMFLLCTAICIYMYIYIDILIDILLYSLLWRPQNSDASECGQWLMLIAAPWMSLKPSNFQRNWAAKREKPTKNPWGFINPKKTEAPVIFQSLLWKWWPIYRYCTCTY